MISNNINMVSRNKEIRICRYLVVWVIVVPLFELTPPPPPPPTHQKLTSDYCLKKNALIRHKLFHNNKVHWVKIVSNEVLNSRRLCRYPIILASHTQSNNVVDCKTSILQIADDSINHVKTDRRITPPVGQPSLAAVWPSRGGGGLRFIVNCVKCWLFRFGQFRLICYVKQNITDHIVLLCSLRVLIAVCYNLRTAYIFSCMYYKDGLVLIFYRILHVKRII